MTKLIAGVLKKVPVPGVEFSNHQFSGGLEMELPGGVDDEIIRQRLRELYVLLNETVEAEITAATEAAREAGFKARFPDPEDNPGNEDAGVSTDGRRHGYDGENRQQGFRRGYNGERRSDRMDGGRQEYRRPGDDRTDYRRDGQRPGGSWRERGGGQGGSRGGAATQAQVKAVFGIAKGQGIERRDLMERVEEQFGVRRVEELNVRQASRLIEDLKAAG